MNASIWFLVHIVINGCFFVATYFLLGALEGMKHDITKDASWLKIRAFLPYILYLIYWVGTQIYHIIYKKTEKAYLYLMFGILAFFVSRIF